MEKEQINFINIIITDYCKNNCPYCFAPKKDRYNATFMTEDNFFLICNKLNEFRIKNIHILGGEPFLHPKFGHFIECLFKNDFSSEKVTIFTGGIFENIPYSILDRYKNKIIIVFNFNEEKYYSVDQYRNILDNMYYFLDLGIEVVPSFTFFEEDFDIDYFVGVAKKCGVRTIRWSISNPKIDGSNKIIPFYNKTVSKKICNFLESCYFNNIQVAVDCGVRYCLFTNEDFGKINKMFPNLFNKYKCKPLLDIDPNLNVSYCYSLSSDQVNLNDFSSIYDIYDYFFFKYNKYFLFPTDMCNKCNFFNEQVCCGPCIGYRFEKISYFYELENEIKNKIEKIMCEIKSENYYMAATIYQEIEEHILFKPDECSKYLYILLKLRKLDKAKQLINKTFYKNKIKSPCYLIMCGLVFFDLGKFDDASFFLLRAIKNGLNEKQMVFVKQILNKCGLPSIKLK